MSIPTQKAVTDGQPCPRVQLTRDIQQLADRLYRTMPKLTDQEKQFLRDQARREGHTLRSLERMADIAARSPDPADREALGDTFRRRARCRERELAGVAVVAIEQEETAAEGALNCAQLERWIHDDAVSRGRVRECALRQLNATERLLEAL